MGGLWTEGANTTDLNQRRHKTPTDARERFLAKHTIMHTTLKGQKKIRDVAECPLLLFDSTATGQETTQRQHGELQRWLWNKSGEGHEQQPWPFFSTRLLVY